MSTKTELLRIAAQRGDAEAVQNLLEEGVTADAAHENGWTALHFAAQRGHTTVVELLLRYEAKQNLNEGGSAPLFWAISNRRLEIVKSLISSSGNVDATVTSEGETALHRACWDGHVDIVEYVLGQRASGNAQSKVRNERVSYNTEEEHQDGDTPLHYACGRGHLTVAERLICAGALCTIKNKNGQNPMDYCESPSDRSRLEALGETAASSRQQPQQYLPRVPAPSHASSTIPPPESPEMRGFEPLTGANINVSQSASAAVPIRHDSSKIL